MTKRTEPQKAIFVYHDSSRLKPEDEVFRIIHTYESADALKHALEEAARQWMITTPDGWRAYQETDGSYCLALWLHNPAAAKTPGVISIAELPIAYRMFDSDEPIPVEWKQIVTHANTLPIDEAAKMLAAACSQKDLANYATYFDGRPDQIARQAIARFVAEQLRQEPTDDAG